MTFRQLSNLSILLVLGSNALFIWGQSGDAAAIQKTLNTQFKLTIITQDRSDIVTAGDIVQLHKPGLVMYAVASPMPPSNTYKNGKIGQGWGGFGKDLAITMVAPGGQTATNYPHRTFSPDEKCWVTGIQVEKDGILFQLYSDPYDDIRYYANLKVPFANKKEVPSATAALQLVSDVLTVVPNTDQGNQAGQGSQPVSDQGGAQNPSASFEGTYFRKDKTGDSMVLGSNGVFSLVQNGRTYGGSYSVEGGVLTISGPNIKGQQRCQLAGNVITDPGGTLWEKPAESGSSTLAATSTPAPMPAIAPPPPPTDAAPVTPPTVALGQTMNQVTAILGQPKSVAHAGTKTKFVYSDLTVIFAGGKVIDVQ